MNQSDILGYFIVGVVIVVCIYVYIDNADSFQIKCIVSTVCLLYTSPSPRD